MFWPDRTAQNLSKPALLDLACLKPYIHATQAILIYFLSQNQQNVKFLAVCLTANDKNKKNVNIQQGKSVQEDLKICTYRFFVVQCTMLELCVTSISELWWFFLIFERKV